MMSKIDECSTCSQPFTITNHAWIISICGHNMCNQCYKYHLNNNLNVIACSLCKVEHKTDQDTIQGFPKNIMVLKRLKNQGIDASKDSSMLLSQFSEGSAGKSKLSLIKEADRSLNEGISDIKTGGLCPKHGRILQIVCCSDGKVMCSHCALFGECKGHKFKTLKDFQNEFNEYKKRMQQIIEKRKHIKQKRSQFVSTGNVDIQQLIRQKISQRHKAIQKQIHVFFDDFIKSLREVQNRINGKVQEIFDRLYKETKECYMHLYDSANANMYNMWQKQALSNVRLIQGQRNISNKISKYYAISQQNIGTGDQLIAKIQMQYDNVYHNLTNKINGVKVCIGEDLIQKIERDIKIVCDNGDIGYLNINGVDGRCQQIDDIKKSVKIEFIKSSGSSKQLTMGKSIDIMKKTLKDTKSNHKIVNTNNLSPGKNVRCFNKSPRTPTSH